MSTQQGKRQGNTQKGLEICTHTCGCVFEENALRKLRRRIVWLRSCPVFLRDGSAARFHMKNMDFHPNCNQECPGTRQHKKGRSLTTEEYKAWAPHLGHLTDWQPHFPMEYHTLFPTTPLEDKYQGKLPTHPLPANVASSQPMQPNAEDALHTFRLMAISGTSSDGLQDESTTNSSLPWKLLFIESPRVNPVGVTATSAMDMVAYDRYIFGILEPEHPIYVALETAPRGYALPEPIMEDDQNKDIKTYQIHDITSTAFLNLFLV
jgi:hypothetical protein